jgi:cell division protein FtsZ
VKGVSDLILVPGYINLDFADVRTIMSGMGLALMGTGLARGENRAVEAAQRAISSPLLEDNSIQGARGVLLNITGGPDMSLFEINEASSLIQAEAHEDANIIFGTVVDESMEDEIRITVIATGFDESMARQQAAANVSHLSSYKREDLSTPAFLRKGGKAAGVENLNVIKVGVIDDLEVDDADFEVPSFLRKKAD